MKYILIGFIIGSVIIGTGYYLTVNAQTEEIPDIGSSTTPIIYQDTPAQATVWSDTAPMLLNFVSDSGCTVTHTNLQGAGSADNASTYIIATSSFTAGNFYILSVGNVKAGTADTPTITGTSAWTEIASKVETGIRTTIFKAQPTSSYTESLTINFSAGQVRAGWSLEEFTNVTSVIQFASSSGSGVNAETDTFPTTMTSGNFAYGAISVTDSGMTGITSNSSYTEITDVEMETDNRFETNWIETTTSTDNWTWNGGGSVYSASLAIELQPDTCTSPSSTATSTTAITDNVLEMLYLILVGSVFTGTAYTTYRITRK